MKTDLTFRSAQVAGGPGPPDLVDRKVWQLFALVSEALAQSTHALLDGDLEMGRRVVAGDQAVDRLTSEVEELVWRQIDQQTGDAGLRHLIGIQLILPELERSADLAEHVAQRAADNLGAHMSPLSRGIVQRMVDVALAMWSSAADAYGKGGNSAQGLAEDDKEIDLPTTASWVRSPAGRCRLESPPK